MARYIGVCWLRIVFGRKVVKINQSSGLLRLFFSTFADVFPYFWGARN